tara:strand:- start:614 stop:976 length:363 start_codon:yes stop_codon:yes gene_type:complete
MKHGKNMLEHLRKYIGLYMTAVLLPFMFGYGVSEEHPIWVWWIAFALVILKTPPYNISDRFWGAYGRLLDWVLKPLAKAAPKWPWWIRALLVLGLLYFIEEILLASIGYTILPWRMDFGG